MPNLMQQHAADGIATCISAMHQKHVCFSCICDYDADATCKACRSPQTWQRPDEFDVDRWRPGGPVPSELTENFAYLPFGGGRRKCIGKPLPLRAHQHCSLLDVCDAGWHELKVLMSQTRPKSCC